MIKNALPSLSAENQLLHGLFPKALKHDMTQNFKQFLS